MVATHSDEYRQRVLAVAQEATALALGLLPVVWAKDQRQDDPPGAVIEGAQELFKNPTGKVTMQSKAVSNEIWRRWKQVNSDEEPDIKEKNSNRLIHWLWFLTVAAEKYNTNDLEVAEGLVTRALVGLREIEKSVCSVA